MPLGGVSSCWPPREMVEAAGHDAAVRASSTAADERPSGRSRPPRPARRLARSGPPRSPGPTARCARRSRAPTCPKLSVPQFEDHGELVRWLRSENLPGHFPFTAGVFPFKRENEDPARMFAGEGGPARTNRRFKMLSEGQPATRLSHRVRLGHALRVRSGRAPRHLRQGGQLRRVHRDARRHEGALRRVRPVRSGHVGVDDHQRPGADDPGDVPQHGDRPTARSVPRARGPRTVRRRRARRRSAARTLRTVRGTVQADILKEDQGQNTCIFSTEFSLGVMADIQEWFVQHEVRNFYSVSHLRLSHRRGGREPPVAAGVHAVERVHLRRGLSRSRHEGRRLRPQPVVLLLQRDGPRVHRARQGRPAHLGGGHEGALRRQRALARS